MPRDPRYAPDGSPVGLYAALPPLGEPELIHAAIPPGAAILELGAGAGRITHPLLELGHPVVAVDQSTAMLSHIAGTETVRADIESLDLGRRFPVVLLASNFLNDPDRERVASYLGTCVRHVEPAGCVVLQKYPRDWQPDAEWRELGAVRARLRWFALDGSILRGEMEYELEDMTMIHAFEAQLIDDDGLDLELEAAGLRRRRFIDESGAWLEAFPTGAATT